ncbi:hypothetical protein N5C55_06485 [Pseudomonas otitidis]|uniref:hypothetical protein n=1 Tax=Metapseudomonas otitidis TaxID=319939 RepID=UPI00244A2C53|nr:hypothetical protein [Pseudomonas otitidis]MDH1107374.1 hypothetical protein [Pseudomonas otitidis]MDH1157809.1 hypothetical protein [Pseudomonas otitidis]MDH1164352.1 hypothetical protein [Pseudomonas otitidis]
MKRNSANAEKQVDQKQAPWEDALILAFRDMQWIRKIQSANGLDPSELAESPALFAKLDGKAETASGDILTGHKGRFFLLEFKSSRTKFSREKVSKSVYTVLTNPKLPEECSLHSVRGHFIVYPEVEERSTIAHQSILPVHGVHLMCMPYLALGTEEFVQKLNIERLDTVFYAKWRGLNLVEMSNYLASLVSMTEDSGGEGTPIKAVIANSDGLFWPVGDLSDFAQFLRALRNTSPSMKLRDHLDALDKALQSAQTTPKQNWGSDSDLSL